MPITQLSLPYPDFQNLQIIDPDKFDANNLAIKNKLDETLGVVNVQELNFNNYYTKANMQVDGQSNLHWNNVTNKPVLADASWKGYASSKATLPLTGNTIGDIRCVLSDSTNDAINEPTQWHCVSTTGTVDQQWKMNGYSRGYTFKLFNDTNTYVNSLDYDNVKLSGNQSIYDIKTFVSSPVVPSPASSSSATNKSYVDGLDASSVKLTGSQSISGVKSFASSPTVPTPSSSIDVTNKSYVDNLDSTNVKVSGAQSISGVKTFSSPPSVPTPSSNSDASNKAYVDNLDSGNVKLSGNQSISGVKTFVSPPIVPSPISSTDTTNKLYVDTSITNSVNAHKVEPTSHSATSVSYDKTGTNLVATNTNSAINELAGKIVAIETVNVNAEVVSARTSTIYNQTFANLDSRFEYIEDRVESPTLLTSTITPSTSIQSITNISSGIIDAEIGGATLYQAVTNGDFANGTTGYSTGNGSLSVLSKVLAFTANSSSATPFFDKTNNGNYIGGNKLFIKTRVRVTNANCSLIAFNVRGSVTSGTSSGTSVSNPVQNQWYDLYAIATPTGGSGINLIRVLSVYADAATANGKVMEIDGNIGVFAIPITGTPYESMTADQINSMLGEYFEGLKSTDELSILSRGRNLFDKEEVTLGSDIDTANGALTLNVDRFVTNFIRLKPSTNYYATTVIRLVYFDKNKQYISGVLVGGTSYVLNPPANAVFVRFSGLITNIDTCMLSEGSTALPYEPNKNSILSVNCTDDAKFALSKVGTLQDEINQVSGYISAVKRNEPYTLVSGDIVSLTNGVNVQWLEVTKKTNDILYNNATTSLATSNQKIVPNFRSGDATTPTDTVGNEYSQRNWSNTTYGLILPLGTYADVNAARTDLVTNKQTKIVYQLATPVFIPYEDFPEYGINVDGALASHSGYTNVSYEADIVPDVSVTYAADIGASIGTLSQSVANCFDRLDYNESRINTIEDMFVSSNATLPLTPTTSIQSVTDGYDGIIDAEIGGATLNQVVVNGDFANGTTGWTPSGATQSVSNKVLSNTGNGSSPQCESRTSISTVNGNKYFNRARMRVTNAQCTTLRIRIYDGVNYFQAQIANPVQNQWYDIRQIVTALNTSSGARVELLHTYADATTANGKVMEVEGDWTKGGGVFAIPITGTPYESYTADQINAMVNEYFEGLKSTNELSILSRGKNLFDLKAPPVGWFNTNWELLDDNSIKVTAIASTTAYHTKLIRLKPNTLHRIKSTNSSGQVSVYNRNISTLLGTSGATNPSFTFTTDSTGWVSVLLYTTSTAGASTTFTDVILNEGSTPLSYEPNKNSILSVNCTDDTKFALNKLDNLVQNEINQASGYISAVKRNEHEILISGDITALTIGTNINYVRINKELDSILYNDGTSTVDKMKALKFPNFTSGTFLDDVSKIGTIFNLSATQYGLIVNKATYADTAAAQTALTGTKILYQLATPLFIPYEDFDQYGLNVDGALASYDGYSNLSYSANIIPDVTLQYSRNISASVDGLSTGLSVALTQTTNHEQRLDAIDDLIPTKLDVSAYTSTDINTKLSNESTISFNPTFGSNTAWSTLSGDWQAYKVGRMVTIVGDLSKGTGTDPASNKLIVQNLPTSLKGVTNNRSFYSGLAEITSNPQVNRYIEVSYDYDGTLNAMTIIFKDLNSTALGDRDLLASSISANTSIKFSITYFI